MDKEGHIKHLSQFVSMAFGKVGAKYNFSKEGVQNLTQAHAGMGITPNDFAIVASHLQGCMEVRCFVVLRFGFRLVLVSASAELLFWHLPIYCLLLLLNSTSTW